MEILKALHRNAELLILDEPTAVLTPQETEVLFKTLEGLKASGKTILFISHKLSEVTRIADRVTVMRDARVITTEPIENLTEEKIARLMVGREIRTERFVPSDKVGDVKLSVRDLHYADEEGIEILKGINFDIRAGEILDSPESKETVSRNLFPSLPDLRNPPGGVLLLTVKALRTFLRGRSGSRELPIFPRTEWKTV